MNKLDYMCAATGLAALSMVGVGCVTCERWWTEPRWATFIGGLLVGAAIAGFAALLIRAQEPE